MRNVWKSDLAVSSVVGISIILVITLLSIGLMLLYTAPLISETQEIAKTQKIEQAFTVLDSRTSKASLGESPLQTTTLSLMGENVEVRGNNDSYNESRIMIIFLSYDSDWYSSFYSQRGAWNSWKSYENKSDFAGLNASMGKVRYYSGDRVIAYEGGGVWSRYPDGGTIMTSPPEFHYNGETMTLPIVKVMGNDSTGGSSDVNIRVKSSNTPVILYPNTTKNVNFTNPLNCDRILIYINSEFYDGWAKYAETLTSTTAFLDHGNHTAIIEMNTKPKMGEFPLTYSFDIPSLNYSNPEPIYNFSFFYEAQNWNAANLNPAGSVVTLTSGTKTLVYGIGKKDQDSVQLKAVNPLTSEAIIYTDSAIGKSEVWKSDSSSIFIINEDPTHNKVANATIDLINNSYLLDYDSSNDAFSWGPGSSTSTTPDLDISYGNANSTQSLNNITQHYLRLLAQDGTIDCTWQQKSNNKIVMDDSTYNLTYDGGGSILTYMHITSNELEVTLS